MVWYDVKAAVCLGVFVACQMSISFLIHYVSRAEAASEHRSEPHMRAPPFRHQHMLSMFYCAALARSDNDEVPDYEEESPPMPNLRQSDVPQPQSCLVSAFMTVKLVIYSVDCAVDKLKLCNAQWAVQHVFGHMAAVMWFCYGAEVLFS